MFDRPGKGKLSSFRTLRNDEGLIILKTGIVNRDDSNLFLCSIVLDRHDIVNFLIRDTHERCGHMETQVVMNTLREKFWIISLRQMITIMSSCVVCQQQKVKRVECESPPLPTNRVCHAVAFESTGIDFAGPVFIKGGKRAGFVFSRAPCTERFIGNLHLPYQQKNS